MAWQAGALFALGAGAGLALDSGQPWMFAAAAGVAALCGARKHIERTAVRRMELELQGFEAALGIAGET